MTFLLFLWLNEKDLYGLAYCEESLFRRVQHFFLSKTSFTQWQLRTPRQKPLKSFPCRLFHPLRFICLGLLNTFDDLESFV